MGRFSIWASLAQTQQLAGANAVAAYRQAVQQGDAEAMNILGHLYIRGDGVKKAPK